MKTYLLFRRGGCMPPVIRMTDNLFFSFFSGCAPFVWRANLKRLRRCLVADGGKFWCLAELTCYCWLRPTSNDCWTSLYLVGRSQAAQRLKDLILNRANIYCWLCQVSAIIDNSFMLGRSTAVRHFSTYSILSWVVSRCPACHIFFYGSKRRQYMSAEYRK